MYHPIKCWLCAGSPRFCPKTPFSGNPAVTGTHNPSELADFLERGKDSRQITLGMTFCMERLLDMETW